ncbi:MAG: Minf_1886 family protein [Kiritimatiellia bacterium]|nr:Minf_1886 family protein [Kiritimatiellia bacterium]
MKRISFEEAIERIVREDARFHPEAYRFVREALDDSVRMFRKPVEGVGRHVSGPQLLEAFRKRALEQFGPMSFRVLGAWGVTRTEDVGEIVFNLVDTGALGKTAEDRREDFGGGYSFEDAFVTPFQPGSLSDPAAPSSSCAEPEPFG